MRRPRSTRSTTRRFDALARRDGLLAPFNAPACSRRPTCTWRARSASWPARRDDDVLLAAALAVRGPRLGHVLRRPGDDPRHGHGRRRRAASTSPPALAGRRGLAAARRRQPARRRRRGRRRERPLRLVGHARSTSTATGARSARSPPTCGLRGAAPGRRVDEACSPPASTGCSRDEPDERQRLAAAAAVLPPPRRRRRRARAPGKTTTVARIVALLHEQAAAAGAPPLVALAAPTGKAAARLRGGRARRGRAARRRPTPIRRRAARARGLHAAPPARLAARAATAASATTAPTGCPTTS